MPALSPTERSLCAAIGIDAAAVLQVVRSPARATLVGEMPGPRSLADAPLFPLPGSSGARLARLAGMTHVEYLASFERVNLFREPREWSTPAARERAREVASTRRKLVLLGARVAAAFGVETRGWQPDATGSAVCAAVPHPSGRNRVLNEEHERQRVGRTLREALLPRCRCGNEGRSRAGIIGDRSEGRYDEPAAHWCTERCERRYAHPRLALRDDAYRALVVVAERYGVSLGSMVDKIVERLSRDRAS